jgi:MoxR-like ATPase
VIVKTMRSVKSLAIQDKLRVARQELAEALIERDTEVDLVLTACLAGEHVLLVGPPGTAKSLLLESVARWLDGKRFSCLLTKFTQMEELFGPVSLQGLKEDRFVRVTTGRLPEADIGFLDEIFKSSSAILNTLLRILNERTFDDGSGIARPVELKLCVAASNEWPSAQEGGQELGALFDRFLFRHTVKPVMSGAGRERLLWSDNLTPRFSSRITASELEQAQQEAARIPWSPSAREALEQILKELFKEGVRPGDRRQRKAVQAARAYAYLNGATQVDAEHLEVLASILWDEPQEQPQICARVIGKIANPAGLKVTGLLIEVEQVLANCDVRNLTQAATAAAKLAEIERQLLPLKDSARGERARAYVQDQLKKLKLASLEAH